jgi:hypothetical protein
MMRMKVLFGFNFVLSAQTSGAEIELLKLAVNHNRSRMDIGVKPAIGMPFGMADILTKHRAFTA